MVVQSKKRTPCEECRDQKRKCNGEIPCERCNKFNLSCVYTSSRSPLDEEYLSMTRKIALANEIETLNHQIKEMEANFKTLPGYNSCINTPPPEELMPFYSDESISSFEDTDSAVCLASEDTTSSYHPPAKRTKLIASLDDVNVYLTPTITSEAQEYQNSLRVNPWTLTLQKGEFKIKTHIKTHSDLLDNLHHMMGTVNLTSFIPPNVASNVKPNTLISVLNFLVLKKYGKTHCKSVAKSVQIYITPDLSTVDTMVVSKSPESIQTTTSKLLSAYVRCQHLQQLAIHVPTFYRLFIDKADGLETSPAIMALCAAVCTFRCKHVSDCLPSISLVEYGKFYFDQARDLLSDLFDQFDLETFTTYVFMTVYKLSVSQTKEALYYADIAERIAAVLKPIYNDILKHPGDLVLLEKGEAVHFKRLLNHLHRMITYSQVSQSDPLTTLAKNEDLPFCILMHMGEGKWELAADDSVQEKWFVQMHGYILKLQRAGHDASKSAQSCDLQHLTGLIGHQVEMAMRHWYSKILPIEFKLSLPPFNSSIPRNDFYTTLDRECAHSAIPALTTLALYEEWLVLCLAYLPKSVSSPENNWNKLTTYWSGGHTAKELVTEKWERRIAKLLQLREMIEFEGSDQDYLNAVNTIIIPAESQVNNHIVCLGLHSAFITIRLLKYLRSRVQDCYFDMKTLINAWQFLLTVSKLQPIMPPQILDMMPRVHKNLTACMAIVKDELKLQPYQGKVGNYVDVMERDLKSQVIEDDDCDCVTCPNA
ncbi:hypothetical protein HPULCUR_011535 [Helicostylum pulchrum]|uniref:Zn(2)-C6 fungal-type domain-containing protein n=1 Tax=Helicostylum pulchrum TaxID=562976 RepID=A0ABP9YGC7_9FUNG